MATKTLSRAYIYAGQIIGPGEVDFESLGEEIEEAITAREAEHEELVEDRTIVDATQSSRLRPDLIRAPNLEVETVTPLTEEQERQVIEEYEIRMADVPTAANARRAEQPRPATGTAAPPAGRPRTQPRPAVQPLADPPIVPPADSPADEDQPPVQ